jgi:hypothetical protein
MISLGVRGSVPKDQQVKAIHIECDSEVQFELEIGLNQIYTSEKNEDYPNGIQIHLVPELNAMISPETRQMGTDFVLVRAIFRGKFSRPSSGTFLPSTMSTRKSAGR